MIRNVIYKNIGYERGIALTQHSGAVGRKAPSSAPQIYADIEV